MLCGLKTQFLWMQFHIKRPNVAFDHEKFEASKNDSPGFQLAVECQGGLTAINYKIKDQYQHARRFMTIEVLCIGRRSQN